MNPDKFVVCSMCRRPIAYKADYYQCSVSTCNRARFPLYFCELSCFSAHLPEAKHRDAWAESVTAPSGPDEKTSANPSRDDAAVDRQGAAHRRVVPAATTATPPVPELTPAEEREVLIVVSKLKAYIKARSGMNTSDSVMDVLSQKVRTLCDEAIRNAARDGRKTVLDRDV